MSPSPTDRFRFPPSVVSDILQGEAIGINLETGDYFSLRGSASLIWTLAGSRVPLASVIEEVAAAFDGEHEVVARSVEQFVAQLVADGLLVPAGDADEADARGPAPAASQPRPPFQPPVIEAFSDMREFLLVDPIHEIDVTEWPNVRRRPGE
jgi:hypothetical protein